MRPSAASCRSRRFSSSRCGGCWPIRARPPRSSDDFAAQWLNLRRVGEVVVHPDFYPDFDDNLLDAFKQETELFIAQHAARGSQRARTCCAPTTRSSTNGSRVTTGFPGIYGSRFRRVTLPNPEQRGGLLAHGAMLATTSYPDRTSPVLRGKWLLDNIFGDLRSAAAAGRRHQARRSPSRARCRRPSASGWRSTGPIRCAAAAMR